MRPIIIKAPGLDTPPLDLRPEETSRHVFSEISNPQKPKKIGTISNRDAFSSKIDLKSIAGATYHENDFGVTAYIFLKAPGTDIIIPPELEQFAPSIQAMVNHNYSQKDAPNRYISIAIFQGTVVPNSEQPIGPYSHHIDVVLDEWLRGENNPRSQRYLINDNASLRTPFYDHRFKYDLNDFKPSPNEEDYWFLKTSQDIKDRIESGKLEAKQFEAGDIINFGITTPHGIINPSKPEERTLLSVNFSDEPFQYHGAPTNNPWLAQAMNSTKTKQKLDGFSHD